MTECVDHGKSNSLVKGYALVTYGGKLRRLHRVVYCEYNGTTLEEIKDLVVRHTCDNPRCIEPTHLVSGTHQDNMDDKVARGRSRCMSQRQLADDQIRAIREAYTPSLRGVSNPNGYRGLSKRFGVDSNAIRLIVLRETYKEVA